MSQSRDRRTSQSREDQQLTGKLINASVNYLNSDAPDEKFGRTVLDGCTSGKGADYPPKGHSYPRSER